MAYGDPSSVVCGGVSKTPDPLDRLDEFRPHDGPVIDLPTVSIVIADTRTDEQTRHRLHRISRWHRRFLRPAAELWFTSIQPELDHAEWRQTDSWERFPIDYSMWCLTQLGYEIETEHVLIAQWDGFALNAERWKPQFLDCDYIGPPTWNGRRAPQGRTRTRGDRVGNGGFSVRSRRLMIASAAIADERHPEAHWEDSYLCLEMRRELEARGFRWADESLGWDWGQNFHEDKSVAGRFGFHGFTLLRQVKQHLESRWLCAG